MSQRHFVMLIGGPGLYKDCDPKHDKTWLKYDSHAACVCMAHGLSGAHGGGYSFHYLCRDCSPWGQCIYLDRADANPERSSRVAELSLNASARQGLLVVLLLAACSGGPEAELARAQAIFSDLALAGSALDYPATLATLQHCRAIGKTSCIRVYEAVKTAKERLFSYPREKALRLTLATIRDACSARAFSPGGHVDASSPCRGALVALYFFNSPQDDATIQQFLVQAPDLIFQRACEVSGEWLANRQDLPAWRRWVGDARLSEARRKLLLKHLDIPKRDGLTLDQL